MERINAKRRARLWRYLIYLYCIVAVLLANGCSHSSPERLSDKQILDDISSQLTEEFGQTVSFSKWELKERAEEDYKASEDSASYAVDFQIGAILFHRAYTVNYRNSKAFGWSLEAILPYEQDTWSVENASVLNEMQIISDLENTPYYTSYSDGLLESRRVLDSEILSREYNAEVGYDRVVLRVVLNAENVHEIVKIECEYLLNEEYQWELFAHEVYLDSVNVQSGVTEDVLLEALKSLRFYREAENGTWWLGELNKLTYDILSRDLDKVSSKEVIEVSFRGESEYMFLSGTAELEFRFSSGWYLYTSVVKEENCETGMISDIWLVDEDILTETLVSTQTFEYGELTGYQLDKNQISDMQITDMKLEEKGLYQTAYFTYNLNIENTVFRIEGYGKYEIVNNLLVLNTWSSNVTEVTYDLSGVWYACDVTEDYLAYYTLNLKDSMMGTLQGQLTAYGVDLTGKSPKAFSATCAILGNVSAGIEYELFVESWTSASDTEVLIPVGVYDFFHDELIDTNSHAQTVTFTKTVPEDRISRTKLADYIADGNIKELLEEMTE